MDDDDDEAVHWIHLREDSIPILKGDSFFFFSFFRLSLLLILNIVFTMGL